LIDFPNAAFYQYKLITFPSPEFGRGAEGVRFVYVPDGVYDRGKSRTNRREALTVAEAVWKHLRDHGSHRSLGVIAFSQAQELAIRDELRLREKQEPAVAPLLREDAQENLEHFFVKSLENVQGDERDSIILSVDYGRDVNRTVALNLGPITQTGGERRLNVAFTRARSQLTVFASVQPEDLDLTRLNRENLGAKTLQDYLYYARDGRNPASADPTGREADSPFEDSVAAVLRAHGLDIDLQVGCSGFRIDMAVRDPDRPGRYALGIECDGATYHSAATARDRDRLRQDVLERLGWRIHRIWSTDWVRDPAACVGSVLRALEDARSHGDGLGPADPALHGSPRWIRARPRFFGAHVAGANGQ